MLADCLKCLYLARIGRPDILWSVNKIGKISHKMTRDCDKRSARLISYIHRTNYHQKYCDVGNRLSIVDWVYSKTQTLLATLQTPNQPLGESYVFSEVEYLFPQVGCVRSKRQCLTVPQNRKLFIYLDARFRMDGILALRSVGCGDRSIVFFKEHPSSSERSVSKREGR